VIDMNIRIQGLTARVQEAVKTSSLSKIKGRTVRGIFGRKCLGVAAFTALILGSIGVGTAGSGAAGAASATKSPYVIGFSGPLTGPIALYGEQELKIDKAYFNYVNAHGGVNGHPLQIVSLDSQGDPSVDATNTTQLITQSHIILMTGLTIDDNCAAVVSITEAHNVPLMCEVATSQLVKTVQPYVFSMLPVGSTSGAPVVQFLSKLYSGQKPRLAITVQNTIGTIQYMDSVAAAAKAKGWNVVNEQIAPLTAVDMTSEAAAMTAAKPTVVTFYVSSELQVSLIHAMRADGYKGIFVGIGQTFDYGTMKTVNDAKFYSLNQTAVVLPPGTTSAAKTFISVMKSAGVRSASVLNSQNEIPSYVGTVALVDGLKACGSSCSGGLTLAKAIQKVNFSLPGVTNAFRYSGSGDGHNPDVSYVAYRWNPSTSSAVQVATGLTPGPVSG
jgi:branched-chain amino acid transport system substrate-binding protein